jgi:dTDP-4-dehydrorhamnose reductase
MKILVTGATGLLGTDIVHFLTKSGHEVLGACFSDRGNGYIAADIRNEVGIKKLASQPWDLVVHCSAFKSPDVCEMAHEGAYKLNVWATEQIAHLAVEKKAKMLFISTDYVFSGEAPPYSESSDKKPINYYGETKLLAEEKIQKILKDVCVLRVPLLYGIRAGIKISDLLNSSLQAINSVKKIGVDDFAVRYPTYTEDVANVICFLIKENITGVYHFSAQNKLTKYAVIKIMAEIMKKSIEHVYPINEPVKNIAKRPFDSHLNINKLLAEGYKPPIPFHDRMLQIIKNNANDFL